MRQSRRREANPKSKIQIGTPVTRINAHKRASRRINALKKMTRLCHLTSASCHFFRLGYPTPPLYHSITPSLHAPTLHAPTLPHSPRISHPLSPCNQRRL